MRVFLIAICLLLVSFDARSQQPSSGDPEAGQAQQQQPAASQQPSATDQRGTERSPLVVKTLPTPKTQEEAAQDAKEREQRAANEQSIIKFNERLIVIGIMQLIVFVAQLFVFAYQAWKLRETVSTAGEQSSQMKQSVAESARAATAMESVAQAVAISAKAATESVAALRERTAMQMRAYLTVVIGNAVYQEKAKNVKFQGKPVLVNTGNTPAYKVGFRANAAILPFPLPKGFDFAIGSEWIGASVLGPHQNFTLTGSVDDFVDESDVPKIKAGGGPNFLHVWGNVRYEDVFGESWHTNFYQVLSWAPGPQGEVIYGVYPDQHNDAK